MNYLDYKKKYPKTLKLYFEWVIAEKETSFSLFFKYLGFKESVFLGEYHHIFTTNNVLHVNTLKKNKNIFSDDNIFYREENEIKIETNTGIDSVLKCLEILINHNRL